MLLHPSPCFSRTPRNDLFIFPHTLFSVCLSLVDKLCSITAAAILLCRQTLSQAPFYLCVFSLFSIFSLLSNQVRLPLILCGSHTYFFTCSCSQQPLDQGSEARGPRVDMLRPPYSTSDVMLVQHFMAGHCFNQVWTTVAEAHDILGFFCWSVS